MQKRINLNLASCTDFIYIFYVQVEANRRSRTAEREAHTSAMRSKDLSTLLESCKHKLKCALDNNKNLLDAYEELQNRYDDQEKKMNELSPIPFIGRVREKGQKGAPSWPLFVWEMMLEHLVNGTPPSAVNANIRSIVERVSPGTIIKELPSIWTIRRARTVLLVVVQALASYRLAKANKWGQINSDETERRQINFQDLVISIEEDELFK